MRRIIALAGIAAALLISIQGAAEAKVAVPSYSDLPKLEPQPQHATACSRIGNFFTRAHYKVITLDEDFAGKVIEQYLSYLDYNRSLLTSAEADSIRGNRGLILRALRNCELDYPFQIYENAMKKRFVKYKYFLDAASGKIDVSSSKSIEIDRRKAPFFESETDLRDEWNAEIQNEYINQILFGKDDAKARERLQKRYSAALQKLVQTKPEDAFSTFENAFASSIDPHTNYFSPADSENFNEDMNLSLEGIGAVLTSDDENTTITEIIPGSPAERSKKLHAKDRIVGVRQQDGTYDDIIGWRLSDVVKKIKGPKGTRVTLDIERGDGANAKSFSVEIVRDRVRLQDREAKGEVRTARDGTRIGVISVKSFYTNLHSDIKRELDKLSAQGVEPDIKLPELVDSAEVGERTEKNALPWDSISPVRYEPYLNISAYVPELQKAHDARTAGDPVFKVLDDEMARYRQLKTEKFLSVNLEKRRAIKAQDDAFRLKAANIRLKAMGKPLLKKISDLPDDFEFADVLLDETVNIASDLARAEREHPYPAATAPVFSRFAPPQDGGAQTR